MNGKNKKTADRILDLIQNEIDLQGKCIEDLSKEIRFHLEQVMDELECSQNTTLKGPTTTSYLRAIEDC